MASPRSSGSRSSSQRPPVRSSGGIPPGLVVAALGIGGVALYFALSGGNDRSTTEPEPRASQTPPKSEPERPKPKVEEVAGKGRAGKTPKKPAPALDVAVFQKTDAWFREADAKYTEGQAAKNKSDSTTYQRKVNEAFVLIEKIDKELEPFMSWQEEADLEGWSWPAEYDVMLRKLGSYSQLKVNLKRSKTLGGK